MSLWIVQAVFKHELAPPTGADLPKIKADWMAVEKFVQSGQYKQLSVKVRSVQLIPSFE